MLKREALRACRLWVKTKVNQEILLQCTSITSKPSPLLAQCSPQELLIIRQKLITSPFFVFLAFFLSPFLNPLHKHSLKNIFCSCLCVTHLFSRGSGNNGPCCLLSEAGMQLCRVICSWWWDSHALLLLPGTCTVALKTEPDKSILPWAACDRCPQSPRKGEGDPWERPVPCEEVDDLVLARTQVHPLEVGLQGSDG